MKPFLCTIVRPLIKLSTFGQSESSENLYSSTHSFKAKDAIDILDES
jgi:hypothetical protein